MTLLPAYLVSFAMIALLYYLGRRNRAAGWRKPARGSLDDWRALLGKSDPATPVNPPAERPAEATSQGLAALGEALREKTPEWEQARQRVSEDVSKPL